ncbi:MAG: hypothetical protein PVH50_05255 [Anaerolineae bacterium]|jgi:hypothetical protein
MRTNRVVLGIIVLLVVAASLVSACGGTGSDQPAAEEPMDIDGETLLQERCTECHTLDRVTGAAKSQTGWEQTVTRMVGRGAELSEEEQAILVDHLAETYGS